MKFKMIDANLFKVKFLTGNEYKKILISVLNKHVTNLKNGSFINFTLIGDSAETSG
jgi:hypothetical protein